MLIPRILNRATITFAQSGFGPKKSSFVPIYKKFYTTKADENEGDTATITIGDVTKTIKPPKNPELVPQKYSEYWTGFSIRNI